MPFVTKSRDCDQGEKTVDFPFPKLQPSTVSSIQTMWNCGRSNGSHSNDTCSLDLCIEGWIIEAPGNSVAYLALLVRSSSELQFSCTLDLMMLRKLTTHILAWQTPNILLLSAVVSCKHHSHQQESFFELNLCIRICGLLFFFFFLRGSQSIFVVGLASA